MVAQKYRWDFIGLSTDTKPTPQTSEKVVNGSTFYCSDTSKLYVFCDGTWYERKPLGGGGGGGSYIAGTGIDITDGTISLDSASQASLAKANTSVQGTDYASSSTAGIVRLGTATATFLSSDNRLSATSRTYANYISANDAMFIGKGTLENVITGKKLDLTQLPTFDATKTQVLKNVNGTLTWINES